MLVGGWLLTPHEERHLYQSTHPRVIAVARRAPGGAGCEQTCIRVPKSVLKWCTYYFRKNFPSTLIVNYGEVNRHKVAPSTEETTPHEPTVGGKSAPCPSGELRGDMVPHMVPGVIWEQTWRARHTLGDRYRRVRWAADRNSTQRERVAPDPNDIRLNHFPSGEYP